MEITIAILIFLLLSAIRSAAHYRARAKAWQDCAKMVNDRWVRLVEERERMQGGFALIPPASSPEKDPTIVN